MADAREKQEEDPGCWQKKAAYEQCFDQWYKDTFLQQKADGKAGCREEYIAYWHCFMKGLRKENVLVEGIKAVMPQESKERWAANMAAHEKQDSAETARSSKSSN